MTVHRETPPAAAQEDPSLARLRMRETALRQKAQQLQARAEHLERVGRGHLERYARRVDAHEKIILGALVKKRGWMFALWMVLRQRQSHQTASFSLR